MQHQCDTIDMSATRATRMRHECYTSDTSATREKNFDFDNDTGKNIFSHSHIYYMASERLQGFHVKILLKSAPKTNLFNGKNYIKELYTRL